MFNKFQFEMMSSYRFDALVCSHRGESKLPHIVRSLLSQTLKPSNIVICSTSKDDLTNIPESQLKSIIHVVSPIANQVVQRAIGLTYCHSDYILQLDDDLTLDPNCSRTLLDFLIDNPKSLVSPLISIDNSSYVPQGINWLRACQRNYITRLYLYLQGFSFSQPKSLQILKFGSIVPLIHKPDSPQKVDWLHSCRMYRKECAFKTTAMLTQGKSYFEDIYSSAEYHSLGYNLFLLPTAIVYHPYVLPIGTKDGISMLGLQYNALKKFNINQFYIAITILLTFFYRFIFSRRN